MKNYYNEEREGLNNFLSSFGRSLVLKGSAVYLIFMILSSPISQAAEYSVSSASEFNSLCSSLSGGDVVTWLNGTYSNQDIAFYATGGTASNPITLKAATSGDVIFTGNSELNFAGSYLVVEGFYWKGGNGTSDHVEFRRSGSNSIFGTNCTIRNCAFDDLYTSEPNKSRWIVIHGSNNVVENCSFINKKSAGAAILVELSYSGSTIPGHTIRNNYFFNITPKDAFSTNSGDCEAIRIGVSSYQATNANVLVEGNYFQAADGENEIITNKSANNTFLHNTFRNCRGSLVLRHGAGARVEGNFFLGEGKAKSGGIRISDRDHVIINNYMQGLSNSGDQWNNGITLVGGAETSGGTGNGYQKVDNILVAFNTIYNSDDPFYYNPRNSYDPTGVIANNLVYSVNGNIVAGDISGTGQGMSYVGNIFGGSNVGITNSGITEGNANFSASGEIYKPSATGIAANAAGSSYSSTVKIDIEGLTRPGSNMDVGAHEISGGTGGVLYRPITDGDVGSSVGTCFLSANGAKIACSGTTVVNVTGVSVSPTSATLSVGGTQVISATVSPSNATNKSISWSSNNTSVATVSSGGVVSAIATGSATITATTVDGNFTATSNIAVSSVSIPVTGVSIMPTNVSLFEGGSQQLTSTVSPSNASDQTVSYSSNNTAIATVSSGGVVSAIAAGSATITVSTNDGNYTATSSVTVTEAPVGLSNVALNKSVTATVTPETANPASNLVDGSTNTRCSANGYPQQLEIDLGALYSISSTELVCYKDRAYQYTIEVATTSGGTYTQLVNRSNNTTPGTVSSPITDNFSAINARFVHLKVTGANGYSGTWVSLMEFRVFGKEPTTSPVNVTGVSLSPSTVSLIVGNTQQAVSTVIPANASNKNVSYVSNNVSIATVSSSGLITAIAEGNATITVTTNDGGYTATSTVNVSSIPVTLTNLALNKSVTYSSQQSSNPASRVVDDNVNSRWSADGFSQWLEIDLGSIYSISSTDVICHKDRAYQYIFESATSSGGPYTQIVDRSNNTTKGTNTSPIKDEFPAIDARYVKITVSGAHNYTGSWVSLDEIRVWGDAASMKSAFASNREVKDIASTKIYPNPFELSTKIQYLLKENTEVTISVYDVKGKLVTNLVHSEMPAGMHHAEWNASDYEAGFYLISISTGYSVENIRVVVTK